MSSWKEINAKTMPGLRISLCSPERSTKVFLDIRRTYSRAGVEATLLSDEGIRFRIKNMSETFKGLESISGGGEHHFSVGGVDFRRRRAYVKVCQRKNPLNALKLWDDEMSFIIISMKDFADSLLQSSSDDEDVE